MKMDYPLYCPSSLEFEGVSRNAVDIQKSFFSLPPFTPPPFFPLTLMIQVLVAAFLTRLVCHSAELPASQWSSDEHKNVTVRQARVCVENEQYLYQGLCCMNCQAGKEKKSQKGK